MPKILYVVNIPRFFVSHRLPLALASQAHGYEVHVATADDDPEQVAKIQATGLPFHPLPLSQHGTSLLTEMRTLWALLRLYHTLKPDVVHHVSIKPVLYGGIAARITGIRALVSAMSGLGYVFIGDDRKRRVIRTIVKPLMRFALGGKRTRMIFQNPDDQARFVDLGMISASKSVLIRGSGVDVRQFVATPLPEGMPMVLFAGRLMWQKGLGLFVESARALRGQARFVVVGYTEKTSPDTVPLVQLQAWADEGIIEWWGKRDDMPQVFAQSHLVCLPSFYGEGVPKVLIEAAACARAIVTTDSAGCREIVRHGDNGILVPIHDQEALTQAIHALISNRDELMRMGQRGQAIVHADFSLDTVVKATLGVYGGLLHDKRGD
jgi:glycosyltransferase involved in cell wall biosynthesis